MSMKLTAYQYGVVGNSAFYSMRYPTLHPGEAQHVFGTDLEETYFTMQRAVDDTPKSRAGEPRRSLSISFQ